MKRLLTLFLTLLSGLGLAQFPIDEPFTGTSAPNWILGNNAQLTAASGIDPAGSGYLRLTGNGGNEKGFAYYNNAFPSSLGVDVDFEYLAWGGTGADGLSLFLFDGSTSSGSFRIGDFGGGLGYCQSYPNSPTGGLSNAYVGIAFDEFGNFSNPSDRCPNGGPGARPDSVAIRGPGNNNTGYAYLTGTSTLTPGIDSPGGSTRPAPSSYYRRVIVSIVPAGSSYQITVRWQTSPGGTFQTLINAYTLPSAPPSTLKLGFAASTGGSTNYHEVRNLQVRLPADVAVTKTGPATVAPGAPISYTINVTNSGPNAANGSTISDAVPATISGVTWTCSASGGAACGSASGSGNAVSVPITTLPVNGSVSLTINGTVSFLAGGTTLNNTATVSLAANRSDPNPNNNASTATTTVSGYTLSGIVYSDLEPNGTRNGSETGTGLTGLFVKRATRTGSICTSPALEAAAVNATTGAYSFSSVVPGDYCLILDNNNTLSDLTPTLPASPGTWRYVSPTDGILRMTLPTTNLGGQNLGLFDGGIVTGRVFYDDGENGGTANNALQETNERGVPNVNVSATQGGNTRTAVTDASGNYTLWLPAGSFSTANVLISHTQNVPTGTNIAGASVSLASSLNDLNARQRTLAYSVGQSYAAYNFGLVRESRLLPPGAEQVTSPGTATYRHLYRPGTLGPATLSQSGGSFTYQARADLNCDGDFDDAGEGFQSLPLNFTVGAAWPRESDGSLAACPLELRVIVPAGRPQGTVDIAQLTSVLVWANNASVSDPRSLADITTVRVTGELTLDKRVRNLTQNTAFGSNVAGRPGETLEYCIGYRNAGTQSVSQVVISDPVPFFSAYVTGTLRLNGTLLSDGLDADAGEVSSGIVVVRIGNLIAGGSGEFCYRVQIR